MCARWSLSAGSRRDVAVQQRRTRSSAVHVHLTRDAKGQRVRHVDNTAPVVDYVSPALAVSQGVPALAVCAAPALS